MLVAADNCCEGLGLAVGLAEEAIEMSVMNDETSVTVYLRCAASEVDSPVELAFAECETCSLAELEA